MFRLGRRGRENMRDMTRETFAVGTDARGRRFLYQTIDEFDSNHHENDRTFETIGEASIYEVPGALFDVSQCIKPETEGKNQSISEGK